MYVPRYRLVRCEPVGAIRMGSLVAKLAPEPVQQLCNLDVG